MKPREPVNVILDRTIVAGEGTDADAFDEYRPKGLCSQNCGHAATEVWQLYKGRSRYDFRCSCCVKRAKCERAKALIAELPRLEDEYHAAEKGCAEVTIVPEIIQGENEHE